MESNSGTMTTTILVVDDDPATLNLLKMHLVRDRFVVLTAGSGAEGLRLAYEHKPEAVILDVRMPGMGGYEVCGRLRDISDAAILFVTVLKAPEDIVRGLELGADDYLIKPFNYEELLARLQACLRRRAAQRRRLLAAGEPPSPWSLDTTRREVVQGNKRVQLTPKEFEVLQFFLDHPDKVLAADELLAQLWGPAYVGDPDLVKQFIYRLRSKLEDNPSEPQYLVTVRGAGYAFEPDTKPSIPKPPYFELIGQARGAAHAESRPKRAGARANRRTDLAGHRPSTLTARLGAVLVALLAISAGAGAAGASAQALPGDWLYPVKRGVETARLQVAGSTRAKAELHLAMATERIEEVETLVAAGLGAEVPEAASGLKQEVRQLAGVLRELAGQDVAGAQAIGGELERKLSEHMIELTVLEQVAGPELGPAIRYAKEMSAEAWADAQRALEITQQRVGGEQSPTLVPSSTSMSGTDQPTVAAAVPAKGSEEAPSVVAATAGSQPSEDSSAGTGDAPTRTATALDVATRQPADTASPPRPTPVPSPVSTAVVTPTPER
jgi:DNA-binding response OmpR family regulator